MVWKLLYEFAKTRIWQTGAIEIGGVSWDQNPFDLRYQSAEIQSYVEVAAICQKIETSVVVIESSPRVHQFPLVQISTSEI